MKIYHIGEWSQVRELYPDNKLGINSYNLSERWFKGFLGRGSLAKIKPRCDSVVYVDYYLNGKLYDIGFTTRNYVS